MQEADLVIALVSILLLRTKTLGRFLSVQSHSAQIVDIELPGCKI